MNQPFRGQYVKGNPPTDMGSAKGIMANPHDILNAVYQPGKLFCILINLKIIRWLISFESYLHLNVHFKI